MCVFLTFHGEDYSPELVHYHDANGIFQRSVNAL